MKLKKACSTTCKKKKRFDKREDAEIRCIEINKENPSANLRPYNCHICSKYHLTSKTEGESKKIRKAISKKQHTHNEHYKNQIQKEADYWIKKKGW